LADAFKAAHNAGIKTIKTASGQLGIRYVRIDADWKTQTFIMLGASNLLPAHAPDGWHRRSLDCDFVTLADGFFVNADLPIIVAATKMDNPTAMV
jgi:hypothetical protein